MMYCKIGWVDERGKETFHHQKPVEAIGLAILLSKINNPPTFPICAQHAARIFTEPDMSKCWRFEPFENGPEEPSVFDLRKERLGWL